MPIVQLKTTFLAAAYRVAISLISSLRQAALCDDFVPRHACEPRFELRPALAMVVEKCLIVRAHLDDALGDAGEHREVAADVRLDIERGDAAAEQQAFDIARHVEPHEAGFDDRVDGDDLTAAAADVEQCSHQPRMVAGRVAADDEYAVGVLQIFEFDGRGAAARDARQADAAGLVAIEAAVVDVVRAVESSEQLQQEAGFVAAAAAEVPECFVGRRGAKFRRDAFERFFPSDWRVAAGFACVANGLDQSAAVFQLARRKLLQVALPNTVPRSRCGWRPACRRPSPAGFSCRLRGNGPVR